MYCVTLQRFLPGVSGRGAGQAEAAGHVRAAAAPRHRQGLRGPALRTLRQRQERQRGLQCGGTMIVMIV